MRVIDGQRRQSQVFLETKSQLGSGPLESGSDDYAGDATTTGVLPTNGSVSGVIEEFGDVDWFAVTLVAGETLTITAGVGFVARFFDSSGEPVAPDFFNSYNTAGTEIQSAFTATATGTYYVSVSGSGTAQPYTLISAVTVGDNPNNLSHAPVLSDGAVLSGAFTPTDQVDWYRFELAAGETIAIQGNTNGLSFQLSTEFGYNVSSSGGGAFRTLTATEAGTYYVAVRGNAGVSYQIATDIFFDDYSDGLAPYTHPNEPAIVTLDAGGDEISGVLETGMDRDVFAIYLEAQQAVRITLADGDGSPTYLRVDLSYVYGGNANHYGGQQSGAGYGELLFTAPVSGIYYLNVSGDITSYTATIAPVVDDFSHDNSRAGVLTDGAFRGVFETSGDIDRFTFSGEAGQILRLDFPGAAGGYALAPVISAPGGGQVLPGFVPQYGGDVTLYRLPETGTYTIDFTGGVYAANAVNYAYNYSLWGDFPIPDSLEFLYPDGSILLFPMPDPGATPTVPTSYGETIQRPMTFGNNVSYVPTVRVVDEGETHWSDEGEAIFLSFSGSSLTNHGTIWTQHDELSATALNGSSWSNIVNFGSIVAMGHMLGVGVNSGGMGVLTNYGDIIALGNFAAAGFQTYQTNHLSPGLFPELEQTEHSSNHGSITAISQQGYATAVWFGNSARFENTGDITAFGLGSASGVVMVEGGHLTNSGYILARQTGDIPLYLPEFGVNCALGYLNFINIGTVDADVAVGVFGILHMQNKAAGLIIGDILVGAEGAGDNSILVNDGLVEGNVFFDIGADQYEGAGLVTGGVFLGGGNDQAMGGALSDLFLGEDGNDTLTGGGGNDILIGGAGVDRLFGDDGNDEIFWDAADDLANVQGGAGTDTLVFTSGGPPVDFNLTEHGFELAEGRFTVTGAIFSDFYDSQWQRSYQIGEADNGSTWYIDWDETNSAPYQRLNQDFDANGDLAREYGLADNGSTWNQYFDTGNTQPWVSLLQVHTAGGVFATESGVADNGSTWTTFYDVDGTNPFVWIQQVRDANGVLAQEEGLADAGSRWFTDWDETGTADFQWYENIYDDQDRLTSQSGLYDNGHTWLIDYDETNAYAWTSRRYDYDENGVLISTTETPDGP